MGARYSRNQGYTISKRSVGRAPVRTTQKKISFGPTTAKFFGLAVLAILMLVMVSNSTKGATNPYDENAIRQQISQVDQDIDSLKVQAQRDQAVANIQQSPVVSQMVPMDPQTDPQYVEKGNVAGVSTARP